MVRTAIVLPAALLLGAVSAYPTLTRAETLDVPVLRRSCAHVDANAGLPIAAGITFTRMKDPLPSYAHEPLMLAAATREGVLVGVDSVGVFGEDFVCMLRYDVQELEKAIEAGARSLEHFRARRVAVVLQEQSGVETSELFKEVREVLEQLGVRSVGWVSNHPVGSPRDLAAEGKRAGADVVLAIEVAVKEDDRKRRRYGTGRVVVVDTKRARVLGEYSGEENSLGSTRNRAISSGRVWRIIERAVFGALGSMNR